MDNNSAFNSNEYDKKIKQTLPYYEDFYRQIVDIIKCNGFLNELSWLDAGCGTGKMAEIALQELNNINRFVFCDSSKDMLNISKKRFDCSNTSFLLSDVLSLNFNNEFDIVTSIMINHYLQKDKRITALKKYYEALKPNGIFFNFENFTAYSDCGNELYLNRWKNYQLSKGKNLDECTRHIARYNKEYFPITLSEHFKIMKDCGFKAVEFFWLSYMQVGILGIK